jgi:hypothetical protein
MVRTSHHFDSRVHEAVRYGVVDEATATKLLLGRRERSVMSPDAHHFYGNFLLDVNLGLDAWLQNCMPGRSVHVPLQRMVMLARYSPGCVTAVTRPLAHALHLQEAFVRNVTRHFAAASEPLVLKSLAEANKQAVGSNDSLQWHWPEPSALQPAACSDTKASRHGASRVRVVRRRKN